MLISFRGVQSSASSPWDVHRRASAARRRYRGESLLLAATVGIVATQLVRLIPYAGAIIVAALWIIGTGAAIAAFFAWRRSRKELAAVPSEEAEGEERSCAAA